MVPIFKYIPDNINSDANYCAIEYGEGFVHVCLLDNNKSLIAQEYFYWSLTEKSFWQPTYSKILTYTQEHNILLEVFVHEPNFTLVPHSIVIDDNTSRDILFLLTGQKGETAIIENVDGLELRNIYSSNNYQTNIITATNNPSSKRHFVTSWLETTSKNNNENKIEAIFYPHYFLITIWKENKLQLVKYIYYKTNEDVLYHLLQLVDFYQLDKIILPIQIYGAIELLSNLIEYLQQYFIHIKNIEILESYHFSEALLDKCPAHLSVPLLSLISCA